MSHLILPNGLNPKFTEPLSEREVAWLAVAEDVCRKLNLTIVCRRCFQAGMKNGAVLKGANDPSDPTISVQCDCRKIVFHKTDH